LVFNDGHFCWAVLACLMTRWPTASRLRAVLRRVGCGRIRPTWRPPPASSSLAGPHAPREERLPPTGDDLRVEGGDSHVKDGVAQAFVVDSRGHQSEQIDLVIHDRHFSPLLFEVGGACYIPAESFYGLRSEAGPEQGSPRIRGREDSDRSSTSPHDGSGTARGRDLRPGHASPHHRRSARSTQQLDPALRARIPGMHQKPRGSGLGRATLGARHRLRAEHGTFSVSSNSDVGQASIECGEQGGALIHLVMRLLRLLQAVGSAPSN
jgi:hypothetical protein